MKANARKSLYLRLKELWHAKSGLERMECILLNPPEYLDERLILAVSVPTTILITLLLGIAGLSSIQSISKLANLSLLSFFNVYAVVLLLSIGVSEWRAHGRRKRRAALEVCAWIAVSDDQEDRCFIFSLKGNEAVAEEESAVFSCHAAEKPAGSLVLSPEGSTLAYIVDGRIRLQGVTSRYGRVDTYPIFGGELQATDISANARVLAVTCRGYREVLLAVTDGDLGLLLLSAKAVGKPATIRIPSHDHACVGIVTHAAFLGEDILYVCRDQSTEDRSRLQQWGEIVKGGTSLPTFANPPANIGWESLNVIAVDVTSVNGTPYVALLVVMPDDRKASRAGTKKIFVGPAKTVAGESQWIPREVESSASSVIFVRNCRSKPNAMRVLVETHTGVEVILPYSPSGDSQYRASSPALVTS